MKYTLCRKCCQVWNKVRSCSSLQKKVKEKNEHMNTTMLCATKNSKTQLTGKSIVAAEQCRMASEGPATETNQNSSRVIHRKQLPWCTAVTNPMQIYRLTNSTHQCQPYLNVGCVEGGGTNLDRVIIYNVTQTDLFQHITVH